MQVSSALPIAAGALLALAVVLPKPAIARAPAARDQSTTIDLSRRALTGGVSWLRAPGAPMVLVPRGTFRMGSSRVEVLLALEACRREPLGQECSEDLFANELEVHAVHLSPYWLDRAEVTVQAYARCAEVGACSAARYEGAMRFRRDDLPVTLVSWDDAQAFCRFVGRRLPTEAEWERAARGREARRFPWGNDYASRRANHGTWSLDATDARDGYEELAPVGSFPGGRSREGFEDLAGNAAEWTLDNYEDRYEALTVTDPKGPAFGSHRVVRGGSYSFGLPWLRGAARMYRPASSRYPYLGFRCAQDAGPRMMDPAVP